MNDVTLIGNLTADPIYPVSEQNQRGVIRLTEPSTAGGKQPAAQSSVNKGDSMNPADDGETPMFIEQVKKHGFNPFALSTEIAKEITSATKIMKKTIQEKTHHNPRDVAQ